MISTLARVEAHVFRVPIKDPVRTSFGTMTERAAVFVKAEDSDGARGWGEIWCNFPNAAAEHRALIFADIVAARALGKPLVRGEGGLDQPSQQVEDANADGNRNHVLKG